jgi:hypothetical protein
VESQSTVLKLAAEGRSLAAVVGEPADLDEVVGEDGVNTWVTALNDNPKPFVWHTTADQILDSLMKYLNESLTQDTTNHLATGRPSRPAGLQRGR